MINTKLYQSIYVLAEKLLEADSKENNAKFHALYVQLQTLCVDNENNGKDHPEQWETLADFTEDLDKALVIYQKALLKAQTIDSKDHVASISFSMAELQNELGDKDAALANLKHAKEAAATLDDDKFKAEIKALYKTIVT